MIVSLRWNANAEPDVIGYRIYAGRATGIYDHNFIVLGEQRPFFPVSAPATEALFQLADGILWHLVVSAIDTSDNEGDKSNEVTAINRYTHFVA